jgi:hypothetical protein
MKLRAAPGALVPGVLALVFVATSVLAAEWSIESSANTRASVTDNLNLTPGTSETTWSANVSPEARFSRRTEASELAAVARLSINRYPGKPDLDTIDPFLYSAAKLQDERIEWGFSGTYSRDSTLQTEQATTGVTQLRRQRTLIGLSPSWQYDLSERASVSATYHYSDATYEAGAGLRDYFFRQVKIDYRYLWSERTALTFGGGGSRFATRDRDILTNSWRLDAGISHSASDRFSIGFNAGYRNSDSRVSSELCPLFPAVLCDLLGIPLQTFVTQTRDSGLLLNANAKYGWERTSIALILSRDINPSGSGLVVETDRLGTEWRYQFSEKLSANLTTDWLRSRYVGGPGQDSMYYRVDSSLSWKMDERWTLGAGLGQAWQKAADAPSGARANTLFLSVGYDWPRLAMSR